MLNRQAHFLTDFASDDFVVSPVLYDISQVSIPRDAVDEDYVKQPRNSAEIIKVELKQQAE